MFTIQFVSPLSIVRRSAIALALLAAASFAWGAPRSPVTAEKIDAADRQAIEKVIREQLDAFGRDDAGRAFAHASPDIQRIFGTPDNFMRMVRNNYEAVYRASSVRFIHLESIDRQWVQTVQLVDEEGHVWRALFTVKRQADKAWKVGGCQLVATSAITT